jgi:hypothetical protein
VEQELRLLVRVHDQKEFLELAGKVQWEGEPDAWRQGREPDKDDEPA